MSNAHAHNPSAQQHVAPNNDPALDVAHEHRHGHLHHDANAERGHPEEVVYTRGTTNEQPSKLMDNSLGDHTLHQRGPLKQDGKGIYDIEDAEKGDVSSDPEQYKGHIQDDDPKNHRFSRFYAKYRWAFHLFIFLFFTGWWIASLVLHRNDKNWLIPFLLWLCISLRLLFFHVPITIVTKPMHYGWNMTGVKICHMIPEKMRIPAGALLTIAVIIVGSFASEESADNTRANRAVSLFGLAVFLFCFWATSKNRKMINWHTVIVGMLLQFIIA